LLARVLLTAVAVLLSSTAYHKYEISLTPRGEDPGTRV